MDIRRKQEIDRFKATDEAGNEYIIICLQTIIESKELSGKVSIVKGLKEYITNKKIDPVENLPQGSIVKGLKEYITNSGDHVNAIDSETFKIVTTDQIVRKIT